MLCFYELSDNREQMRCVEITCPENGPEDLKNCFNSDFQNKNADWENLNMPAPTP